jgi:hypothetical protein
MLSLPPLQLIHARRALIVETLVSARRDAQSNAVKDGFRRGCTAALTQTGLSFRLSTELGLGYFVEVMGLHVHD